MKSRFCADGSKQRLQDGYRKEDAASPTVSTDNLSITCVIDAYERHKVAVIDLPGAFLKAQLVRLS